MEEYKRMENKTKELEKRKEKQIYLSFIWCSITCNFTRRPHHFNSITQFYERVEHTLHAYIARTCINIKVCFSYHHYFPFFKFSYFLFTFFTFRSIFFVDSLHFKRNGFSFFFWSRSVALELWWGDPILNWNSNC